MVRRENDQIFFMVDVPTSMFVKYMYILYYILYIYMYLSFYIIYYIIYYILYFIYYILYIIYFISDFSLIVCGHTNPRHVM